MNKQKIEQMMLNYSKILLLRKKLNQMGIVGDRVYRLYNNIKYKFL